jgi:hypothetical protein
VDRTLVFGLRCKLTGTSVPNDFIARYVASARGSLLGVAAFDPQDGDAASVAGEWLARKEFCGLTVSPAMQDFHPADSRAMKLYDLAAQAGKCVFFCQGEQFPCGGRLEFIRPALLDEVAKEFPSLTIVVSSLGYPWVDECVAMLARRNRVFADLSGLARRPWQLYNALVTAHQFNVMDKILFGSDFPFFTAAEAIEGLYRLNEVTHGTNLPSVPREALRSVVERPALVTLGIEKAAPVSAEAEPDEEEVAIND